MTEYSTSSFNVDTVAMRYSDFAPRLFNFCLSLGMKPNDIMPSRAFCSDENQGYPIIFVSAKTHDNIAELFTLVVFDYLKKLEESDTEKQFQGISKNFLTSVAKSEENLDELIININKIDSKSLHKKITPRIIEKSIKITDNELGPLKEITDLKKIREFDLDKNKIKETIFSAFKNNLVVISELVSELKKSPINALIDNIDKTLNDLSNLNEDFELKLDSILELEKSDKNN